MPPKYLSLRQAQRLLPTIQKKILKLRKVQQAIDMLGEIEVECDDIVMDYHYNLKMEKEYFRLQYEFYTILEQLDNVGCLLKDLDTGLVDFVHQHEGQDVFLCWKEGEKNIQFWHDVEEGYEERKPIMYEESLEQ